MSLKRRIQYQLDNYRRMLQGTLRYTSIPAPLTGRPARYIYLFVLVIISVAYVCQTSSAAGSGYEMRDLQGQVDGLRDEIQKIEVDIASYNSMSYLETKLSDTNMVRVDNMRYLTVAGPAVAKK